MNSSKRPIFYGESSEEAEDFVFSIKERAYQEGKHKDHAWTAEYASICFAKGALRWYEELDEDTQSDWRLLRRAILAHYKDVGPAPSTVPTAPLAAQSPALRTIPAAAPLSGPSLMWGRIAVESECPDLKGYIAKKCRLNYWCCVSRNLDDAALFELNVPARTLRFQDSESGICVRVFQDSWMLATGSTDFSGLFKGTPDLPGWSDLIKSDIWLLGTNHQLIAAWPQADGGMWPLDTAAWTVDQRIYLVPDCAGFTKAYGSNTHKKITLCFQPSA